MHSSLRINKLFLLNYRNHKKVKIEVNKNIVLLVGKNGSGKTNILESVSLLASSNGMRNSNFKSLISEDSKFDEFGVVINLENSYDSFKVGIGFSKKDGVLKKIIKFNGIEVNKNVIESKFSMLLFSDDLMLNEIVLKKIYYMLYYYLMEVLWNIF